MNRETSIVFMWRVVPFFALFLLASESLAFQDYKLSKGQTVYVSVYSNIFTAPKAIPFYLETTLIIRNTDIHNSLTIEAADFYDTEGKLVKHYFPDRVTLRPLETKYLFLPGKDGGGGLGANFVVRWSAPREINAPIIECLMSGTKSGQGISFVSQGQVIKGDTR